jgi:GntR family transcriptional repressor for pyruvate dehydrogenase complex
MKITLKRSTASQHGPRSLVDELCDTLAKRIRRDLGKGRSQLPTERELAVEFEVSRTVVREATKRLELQGLLEVRHGIGLRLVDKLHAPLNGALELLMPDAVQRLRLLIETRQVIEPELARLAAERAKPEHLRALRSTQQQLENAVDTAEAIDADVEFHRLIAAAAGNGILELVLKSLGDLGRESRRATIAVTGSKLVHEHHGAILKQIEQRRPQGAFDAMARHLAAACRDLKNHFVKQK